MDFLVSMKAPLPGTVQSLFSICLKPLESLRGPRLLCSASNNTDLGLQFAVAQ